MPERDIVFAVGRRLVPLGPFSIKSERLALFKAARILGRSRRHAAAFVRQNFQDFSETI